MDLLWWCNQFQRLDFRIETIHHSPCQGKVYLHTAVTHCSFWIPRADEDPLEENTFCCFFFHCCWGQSLELWQLQQLQSILVPLRDSSIQEQTCLNILFIHSAMGQCRLCYRSFPTSLFYFRISRAFYQVEAFRGREYNDFNRNDGERPALVQILLILKHWALSTWVMLMRGKRRGAMRWTSPPYACTDPLLHIWGLSQAGDPNNCRYTCPAIAGNGSPGPLQQRTRLRTEVA